MPNHNGGNMETVQRLQIENDCRKLPLLYAYHIDHHNPEAFVGLWTEDAVFRPSNSPGPIVGREEISAWIESYPQNRLVRHVSTSQFVEVVDERNAVGTSYTLVFRDENPKRDTVSTRTTPRSVVEYVDKYSHVDGQWKFAERVYRVNFLEADETVRPKPVEDFPSSVGSLRTGSQAWSTVTTL